MFFACLLLDCGTKGGGRLAGGPGGIIWHSTLVSTWLCNSIETIFAYLWRSARGLRGTFLLQTLAIHRVLKQHKLVVWVLAEPLQNHKLALLRKNGPYKHGLESFQAKRSEFLLRHSIDKYQNRFDLFIFAGSILGFCTKYSSFATRNLNKEQEFQFLKTLYHA